MQNHTDVAAAAVKATPPVIVSTMAATGITLSDILIILTIAYTALQLFFLVRDKHIRDPYRKLNKKTADVLIEELDKDNKSPALYNSINKFIEINKDKIEEQSKPKDKE